MNSASITSTAGRTIARIQVELFGRSRGRHRNRATALAAGAAPRCIAMMSGVSSISMPDAVIRLNTGLAQPGRELADAGR